MSRRAARSSGGKTDEEAAVEVAERVGLAGGGGAGEDGARTAGAQGAGQDVEAPWRGGLADAVGRAGALEDRAAQAPPRADDQEEGLARGQALAQPAARRDERVGGVDDGAPRADQPEELAQAAAGRRNQVPLEYPRSFGTAAPR